MSQYRKCQKDESLLDFCPWEISHCDFGLFTHVGLSSLARQSANIDALRRTIVVSHVRFTVFTQSGHDVATKLSCNCETSATMSTFSSQKQDGDDPLGDRGCVSHAEVTTTH